MGALTLKAFSDELREWEFTEKESIDPTDSFGTSLRLSIRENQVFLAEPNDHNTPWLTDKGRLFFDGMFEKVSDKPTDWKGFFNEIVELMYLMDHLNYQKKNVLPFIFAFENLSLETLNMLYLIKQNCSFVKLRKAENHKSLNDLECNYQLSSNIQKPRLYLSSLCFLLNINSRYEGYVLNLNLRQRFLKGGFKLFNIGSMLDLTIPTYNLGSNISILQSLGEGTHVVCQDIKNADFPIFVTNTEILKRDDAQIFIEILKYAGVINLVWNVLNHSISSAGIQLLSQFLPLETEDFVNFFGLYYINVSLCSTANVKKLTELRLLGIFSSQTLFQNSIIVDQNTKLLNKFFNEKAKDKLFKNYFYLPNSLFLEDNGTYVNTHGLIKKTTKLIQFKKESKTDWQITRKFYANTQSLIFFNNKKDNNLISFASINLFHFRNYTSLQFYAVQMLSSLNFYLTRENSPIFMSPRSPIKQMRIKLLSTKVKNWLDDFFNNNGKDSFSYSSSVLINCSKIARISTTNFF